VPDQGRPLELFFSYSHQDEALRDELAMHLSLLEHEGLIRTWHDRSIEAGKEWEREIDHHLHSADIILLLVSPPFIASRYCWSVEMKEALDRHSRGEARVIPIILRPVEWKSSPIGVLQALPRDGKPVVEWQLKDRAFVEITAGIRQAIAKMIAAHQPGSELNGEAADTATSSRFVASDASDRCIKEIEISRPGNPMAMAWSSDGHKVALGTDQETVILDLRNDGRIVWQSARDTYQLLWSPDGALAVVDSEACSILEGTNGKTRWSTPNFNGVSMSISWSPDGRCLACGNEEEVSIHESLTGRELCQLKTSSDGVFWSPRSTCLAIGGHDQLQLWCVNGPEAPSLQDLSIQAAKPLAWSPDGYKLAMLCRPDLDIIHVWNTLLDSPDIRLNLKSSSVSSSLRTSGLAWSPKGTWIAVATFPEVEIFNSADGREILTLSGGEDIYGMDLSPDGLHLASITPSTRDRLILRIWDLSDLP
jgi:hypothetical protein